MDFFAFCFLTLIYEVYADYCGDNKFCHAPYKCCDTRKECCYDSMLHSNQLFRMQVWNMWYFWLLIIFILMSCFGGCGYYRRRRLALLSRSNVQARPQTVLPAPCQRSTRRSRSQEGGRQFNFFSYNGPGFTGPDPLSNSPPAYYEVVNQPNLFPATKVELPPYPGLSKTGEENQNGFLSQRSTVLPPSDVNLPPPYTEFQSESPPPSLFTQPSVPQESEAEWQSSQNLQPAISRSEQIVDGASQRSSHV